MQGDSISYNLQRDTNNIFYVYCKPDTSHIITKADSLQLQTDSLDFKYFFNFSCKHANCIKINSSVATRESMFTAHQLHIISTKPLVKKEYSNDWMVILLLLCFSLLAWILIFSRKRVKQIIKATYTNRTINHLIRDGDLFKERISLAFTIIYFLSISLFIFQISHYFFNIKQLGFYSFLFYIKIFAVIIGLYILKQVTIKFIGFVFKNNMATYIYLLNRFIFNIIIGILLLPLLLFMIYSKDVVSSFSTNFSIILVITLNLLKYFRYIILGVSFSKFSHFYLFLYLCTLEVLPMLIIIKIIIGLIDCKL